MNTVGLYWRTIRHLTLRQIVFQLWHRLRSRPQLRVLQIAPKAYFIATSAADKPTSWQKNTFTFLNQTATFAQEIDWNYGYFGKLWTYNLNYFDFLNQPNVTAQDGLALIRDFMAQTDSLRDGLEPYPTSLRIGNWIRFLSRHRLSDDSIQAHLFAQTHLLSQRFEYHLSGNHLLENGFSLLTAAFYFRNERWLIKAKQLIQKKLNQQILNDGCHNERSPMYHQLLLDRLLDCLLMLQTNRWIADATFVTFMEQKAAHMLNWLGSVTFRNDDIPLVNDAAIGIAPTTKQLRRKANHLLQNHSLKNPVIRSESGYRLFRQKRYELFVDVGVIGPDNQPGHAHADTFSFILYVDNSPVIVDTGTSTYQTGNQRDWELSTAAHNTVEVARQNSSEVWAGFRVGRRARTAITQDTPTLLSAQHDGYRHLGILHQRSWSIESSKIVITDSILNVAKRNNTPTGTARFHLHPNILVQKIANGIATDSIQIHCQSATKPIFSVSSYVMAEQFNQLRTGQCLDVTFANSLTTTITFADENTLPDILF